jgi:hypothetical protein
MPTKLTRVLLAKGAPAALAVVGDPAPGLRNCRAAGRLDPAKALRYA